MQISWFIGLWRRLENRKDDKKSEVTQVSIATGEMRKHARWRLTTVTASCELEVINDLDIPIACKFLIEDS